MDSQAITIAVATVISPIIPTIISIILFRINRKIEFRNLIEERLFKIQQIAFEYPFVEDDNFIKGEKMNDKKLSDYLRYEQYCEMIFNLLESAVRFYKTEEKLLKFIDFKSWVRTHRNWWNNPLDEGSNYETYDRKVVDLVRRWLEEGDP